MPTTVTVNWSLPSTLFIATPAAGDQAESAGNPPTTKHCFVPAGTFTVKVTSASAGLIPKIAPAIKVSKDFFI